MSTPVTTEIARTESSATAATPSGVTSRRAARAHPSDRQAMSRGPCASCTTGSEKLVTSSAPGMSSGATTMMNGAATTAIPKPIDDCTKAPARRARPRSRTGVHSIS